MKPFVVLDNWHIDQPPTRFELALSNSQLPFKVYKTNRGEFPDTLEASGVFVGPSVSGAYDQDPWIAHEQDVLRAFAGIQTAQPRNGLLRNRTDRVCRDRPFDATLSKNFTNLSLARGRSTRFARRYGGASQK